MHNSTCLMLVFVFYLEIYVTALGRFYVTVSRSNLLECFMGIMWKLFLFSSLCRLPVAGWAEGRGWRCWATPFSLCSVALFPSHCIFVYFLLQCVAVSYFIPTKLYLYQHPPPSLPGLPLLFHLSSFTPLHSPDLLLRLSGLRDGCCVLLSVCPSWSLLTGACWKVPCNWWMQCRSHIPLYSCGALI